MRFTVVATLATTLGSLAVAQLGNLPKCAQDCFGSSLGSCSQLDFKCVCGNSTLISSLSCCVAQTCTREEQDSTIQLAVSLCKQVGVNVPTSASCASSTPASTPAPSSSSGAGNATNATASTSAASGGATPTGSAAGVGSSSPAAGVPMATAGAVGLAMGIAGMVFAL
ncbi:hypothetical protein CC80DRAFT_597947 [Byssothecium circinans]|uniref:CFEM domain-containing protein n=1 Tax=Byssothecium circinans TaxID=147558 RepID=A0A6A5TP14_9PLEO|nr:hypothetical protein CC80DRAFT_597947 [Byssothecium circinans]